jgi:hypothetical protein
MGSWGRAEVTAGSDDDFMVLVHGPQGSDGEPPIDAVSDVLNHAPRFEIEPMRQFLEQ